MSWYRNKPSVKITDITLDSELLKLELQKLTSEKVKLHWTFSKEPFARLAIKFGKTVVMVGYFELVVKPRWSSQTSLITYTYAVSPIHDNITSVVENHFNKRNILSIDY